MVTFIPVNLDKEFLPILSCIQDISNKVILNSYMYYVYDIKVNSYNNVYYYELWGKKDSDPNYVILGSLNFDTYNEWLNKKNKSELPKIYCEECYQNYGLVDRCFIEPAVGLPQDKIEPDVCEPCCNKSFCSCDDVKARKNKTSPVTVKYNFEKEVKELTMLIQKLWERTDTFMYQNDKFSYDYRDRCVDDLIYQNVKSILKKLGTE